MSKNLVLKLVPMKFMFCSSTLTSHYNCNNISPMDNKAAKLTTELKNDRINEAVSGQLIVYMIETEVLWRQQQINIGILNKYTDKLLYC